MLAIEPFSFLESYEELRTIRVFSSISHWEQTWNIMRKPLSLIFELSSVNWSSSHSVLLSYVSCLQHELRNYSVNDIVQVVQMLAFFSSTKASEIFSCSWHNRLEKLKNYLLFSKTFFSFFAYLHLYEGLRILKRELRKWIVIFCDISFFFIIKTLSKKSFDSSLLRFVKVNLRFLYILILSS